WKKTSLRGIVIGFGSFPTLIGALLAVLRGRDGGFLLTAKQRRTTQAWSHLLLYLAVLLCCLAGIGVGLTLKQGRRESVAISILWVLYDVALLVSFLWLGIADVRYREAWAARRQPARMHLQARVQARIQALGHAILPSAAQVTSLMTTGLMLVSGMLCAA